MGVATGEPLPRPIFFFPKMRCQAAHVRTPPQWRATGFSRALSVEYISTELSTPRRRGGSAAASVSSLRRLLSTDRRLSREQYSLVPKLSRSGPLQPKPICVAIG